MTREELADYLANQPDRAPLQITVGPQPEPGPPMGALADQGGQSPFPDVAPPAAPAERDAFEAAAGKTQAKYRNVANRAGESNMGAIAESLMPQEPWEWAMMAAAPGAGLAGRALAKLPAAVRAGLLAGGIGATSSEAEGGPLKGLKGFAPGSLLGLHPSTRQGVIHGKTLDEGGYSVNLGTGEVPTEGLMVGKYKNTDPRNMVLPQEGFRPSNVKAHATANVNALSDPNNYLGTWLSPEGQVYLDVSKRFAPDKIRAATKFGERTGQLAGRDVAAKADFPIGNWRDFVASPEFRGRVDEMADVGRNYLKDFPTKEWWDMHGSNFERAYGQQNLPQVAGFSAATAPVSNPYDNMRAMSVYMGRHIRGEPIVQPDFRIPGGGMGPWSEGKKIPLEQSRVANLEKAAAGDLESMQRAKVREEAKAMSGDPNAAVFDRHWARLTEAPERGIYANATPGVINTGIPKRGVGDYDFVKGHVGEAAKAAGRDIRDFSADAWTGIRETIKNTNQLFGTPFRGSAITGDSKSYQDIFQELLEKKAQHMGISTDKLDKMLQRGDADLLSTVMVGSPVLWGAYQSWQSQQEPKMGGLADQTQYQ